MTGADDAAIRAMDALRRLVSALRTSGVAASAQRGMSVAQLFALRVIGLVPGLSMGELAKRTLTTPSAVSEVVSRLSARGLVRRELDSTDRRRALLHLTTEGHALFVDVPATVPERLVASLATMDTGTVEILADTMEMWVASAGFGDVSPSMFGEGEAPARVKVAAKGWTLDARR
jgi:DNA-binding MarR family transcriptional regulator